MSGNRSAGRTYQPWVGFWVRRTLLGVCLSLSPWPIAPRADSPIDEAVDQVDSIQIKAQHAVRQSPEPIQTDSAPGFTFEVADIASHARRLGEQAFDTYQETPPGDRVAWGGLAVCCLLGLSILLERMIRLRERKIIPSDFTAKFRDRLHGGKLDAGRALDYCEENPSPAARLALAAERRWGRPAADLERAVALAHRVEADRLTRHVGTLRRIAALAPLVGFLGTLLAVGRILASIPPGVTLAEGLNTAFHWGPELASALSPMTAGIVIATLAVVAYDGLAARIERLTGALDRLGAETLDAIAMTVPATPSSLSVPTSRPGDLGIETLSSNLRMHPPLETAPGGILGLVRPPHQSPSTQAKLGDLRAQRHPRPGSEGNGAAHA